MMELIGAMAAQERFGLAVFAVVMAVVGFRGSRDPWREVLLNPLMWIIFGISAMSVFAFGSWPLLPSAVYTVCALLAGLVCCLVGWKFGRRLAWRNPARHQAWIGDANLTGELFIRNGTKAELYFRKIGFKGIQISRVTFSAPHGVQVGAGIDRYTEDKNRHEGSTVVLADPDAFHVDVALYLVDPADAARVSAQVVWHVKSSGLTLTKTIRATKFK